MDGLEAAQRARPDVILCDIGLPDSDGFALAEVLRPDSWSWLSPTANSLAPSPEPFSYPDLTPVKRASQA
jgi:CheY-like chemotaxis protein